MAMAGTEMNSTGMAGMNSSSDGMDRMDNGTSGMGGMSGMGTGDEMSGMGTGDEMSGMGGMSMGGMMMYFHAGYSEYILFKQLLTESEAAFGGACVAVFVLAILYELLKFWREDLQRRYLLHVAHVLTTGAPDQKTRVTSSFYRMGSHQHLLQTILHAVQIFLSYCLMLIFMTYNAYLAICIVFGAATGYFLVGWRRTHVTDSNEHCH